MTIPAVTRLEDWRFALYDLAACTKTVLNPDMIIDPQVEVVPGVGMERLKSCTFEIPFLANARAAIDFDALQLLCIDRWGDPTQMLWGVVQKPKEGYSARVRRDSVQVTAASVEELLKARKAVQYAGGVALPFSATAYPDDFAKLLVTTCFTGNDLDGNSRAWEWGTLVVDADASECADTADLIVLSGNEQDDTLYKHLDDLARAYDFDFQLQVTIVGGAFVFTFKTQAPYGGSDLTTGASRVTIKDLYNLVPNATRYRDATYRATRMYTRGYLLNVEDAAEIAKWGVWEGVAEGIKLSDAEIALEKARVKEGAEYGYEATGANGQMALWGRDFKAGDKVNRVNNRLGIAADSEKIAGVTARFQNKVLAVTIKWGDREPGATDRQSGGAYNPVEEYGTVVKDALPVGNANSPGVDPMHEVYGDHIHALLPMADDGNSATITAGAFTITGSDGIATSIIDGKLVISGAALLPAGHTHAHGDLTGVSANQHHNQAHVITGADHSVTGDAMQVVGLSDADTIGLLTPSSSPGAASAILKTDASGNLSIQEITATKFVFDDSEYISPTAGTITYNASNFHRFYIGAAQHLIVQDGYVFPGVTNNTQLGQSSYRWSNVYAVLGNFSSTITAGGGSTAIACSGNITMVNGKTVDGVDVSAHGHRLTFTSTDTNSQTVAVTLTWGCASTTGGPGHEHTYEKTTAATASSHRHRYDKTNTPTGAPA